MTEITFRSDMAVELIDHMGTDYGVAMAARVSTNKDRAITTDGELNGLINFLMKNRHGTPFEHNAMTFRIEAPIFVWREFHRHRIGFSYNEMSGRYTQLPPEFYVPAPDRPLVQVGKPGAYTFEPGNRAQVDWTGVFIKESAQFAYSRYEQMLGDGVAKEVARMVLPVNIYSVCYVTCNARSLMSFLSLRTKDERAMFPSYPQREIEMVAEQIEVKFRDLFPLTWNAWVQAGRVAP